MKYQELIDKLIVASKGFEDTEIKFFDPESDVFYDVNDVTVSLWTSGHTTIILKEDMKTR